MTLSGLESDLYRRLNYDTSPASAVTTRLRAFLNETQNEILSEPGMGVLLNGSLTFVSVADTQQYSLPQAAARVKTIYEATNHRKLEARSLEWYRAAYPNAAANTGTPEAFIDLGLTSIATQPSNASQIFVDSTSGSDTNTAYLEGYRTGGYFNTQSISMTGTTAVSLDAAITDFLFLTKFYISAAAIGTVTLHEDASGGTELARIPIGQTYARYRRVALAPTPSAALTYTLDFEWDPADMANANDEPILPPRFHRVLLYGALKKEYEKKDDTRYAQAIREYERGLDQLKFFAYTQAVGRPNLRGPLHRGYSRLGPNYPS
jgi:hypothetical protein